VVSEIGNRKETIFMDNPQDEIRKQLGLYYNPLRWLLRRFLSSEKTDEVMLYASAMLAGEAD
jgi:hypothetical protein